MANNRNNKPKSRIIDVKARPVDPPVLQAMYNDDTLEAHEALIEWCKKDYVKVAFDQLNRGVIYGRTGTIHLVPNYWVVRIGPGDFEIVEENEFLTKYKKQ